MRNLDSSRCWRCTLCPCKVRNKFLINFWNRTILLCIPCIMRILYPAVLHNPYSILQGSRVLLEELTGFQLVQEFSAFYGTRRFNTAITSAHHLSLSWVSSVQSILPHPTSWRSILILSSHLHVGLPGGLKVSIQVWGKCSWYAKKFSFQGEELSTPRPTPQAGGTPLVVCPRLLIQYIRRPFLHPQPEDAPCRGDTGPLITHQ